MARLTIMANWSDSGQDHWDLAKIFETLKTTTTRQDRSCLTTVSNMSQRVTTKISLIPVPHPSSPWSYAAVRRARRPIDTARPLRYTGPYGVDQLGGECRRGRGEQPV
jgi:hypothetical protein